MSLCLQASVSAAWRQKIWRGGSLRKLVDFHARNAVHFNRGNHESEMTNYQPLSL